MAVRKSMAEQLKQAQRQSKIDIAKIPETRVPVAICADTSGSMEGEPIQELNQGIDQLYREIWNDPKTKNAAEICLIGFNNLIEVEEEFDNIRNQRWCQKYPEKYELEAAGRTYLGLAVNAALDRLEKRKEEYQSKGVAYYQPWLVIMTDGDPSEEDDSNLEKAIKRVRELESKKKLTVFCVGIGKEANMKVLRRFSAKRTPLRLDGLKFTEFFEWLSMSMSAVAGSTGTEEIPLPPVSGWASL